MQKIPADTLVVVADGRGARLFRNVGSQQSLSLKQIDLMELMNANDEGPSGVAPPESDGKSLDEATFAKQLANRINAGALEQRYEHLVLIADAQTLGQMRPQLHKEAQSRLVVEISKDLTNSPLEDIEKAIS